MSEHPSTVGAPGCYRHPDRATYISCQRCGKPICPDCMVSASVGYQCPGCVNEGRRTVRQGRNTFGGAVPGTTAVVTFALAGINVVVWLVVLATGGDRSGLVNALGLHPRGGCLRGNLIFDQPHPACTASGGSWLPSVADDHAYWQLLTSMFLHVTPTHIFSNLLLLVILGLQLEPLLGRARFLAVYLVSGLAGSALAFTLQDPFANAYGASGAVFGLLAAMLVVGHRVRADLRIIGVIVVINLVSSFTSANISWQAHVGGLVGGLAMSGLIVYAPRGPNRARVQWLGTGALVVLLAVVVLVRAAVLG